MGLITVQSWRSPAMAVHPSNGDTSWESWGAQFEAIIGVVWQFLPNSC